MDAISWIIIIIFSIALLSNENNHEVAIPVAWVFLFIIIFIVTPRIIYQVVRSNEFCLLFPLLGGTGYGVLFSVYTLYNPYDNIYDQPVVPAAWWTLGYLIMVVFICFATRKSKN